MLTATTREASSLKLMTGRDDLKNLSVTDDLYAIPTEGSRYILYGLLSGVCLLVNRPTVELIDALRDGRRIDLDRRTLALLNYFILYRIASLEDGAAEGGVGGKGGRARIRWRNI